MTLARMLLGLALVWAAGALLAWRLWPARAKPALLLAALAWPAGLALTSSAYFLLLVVSGGRAAWYPGLELAGLALAAVRVWRRRRAHGERLALPPRPRMGAESAALLVLALVAATALVVILRYAAVSPWGYWDAWARINLKARFLHAGGAEWTWIFRGDGVPHHDYPLLLECSVARLWQWSGGVDPLPAQVLSVLGWGGCLVSLLALAGHLRSPGVAAAAGLLFLADRSGVAWAGMQYADFALGTYFTWSAGLLMLAARDEQGCAPWWPLLGFCAGSAAWCKNEGLVFAVLVLALGVVLAVRAPAGRRRGVVPLAAGFLLGGAALLVLKLGFAHASSLFGARSRSVWADLGDPARYRIVGEYLLGHFTSEVAGWTLGLGALALCLFPRRSSLSRAWLPLGICAAMALVFVLVLVTTSEDLDWHAGTTCDRLVLQLWPLATLAAVAALGTTSTDSSTTCSSAS